MNKKIAFVSLLIGSFTSTLFNAHAQKAGDVIGTVYNTDIVAYINNYALPSYAANGTSLIVAEDLRNFGFDVEWNDTERALSITRNLNTTPNEMNFKKTGESGSVFSNLLYSDVSVYAAGVKIPSYAINGYSMIPMESLTMFGDVFWVAEQRALKLWVEGLHVRSDMQKVEKENPAAAFSVYNGIYKGGGTFVPKENHYIGLWSAALTNVTPDSINLSFGQSESNYGVEMILYKQPNGSYYGAGYSDWGGYSYITIWLETPQRITLTVTGAADSTGTETLRR